MEAVSWPANRASMTPTPERNAAMTALDTFLKMLLPRRTAGVLPRVPGNGNTGASAAMTAEHQNLSRPLQSAMDKIRTVMVDETQQLQ